jgi:ketosteroid isomerase-like protein
MNVSDRNAVLFANTAFYAAFAGRDLSAMENVWAKDQPISCSHPGWQPLTGRAEVMASWRSILDSHDAPEIVAKAARAAIYGDCAVVTCIEQIGDDEDETEFLTATNIFVRAGSVWMMVHHQAGPLSIDPHTLEEDEEERPAMN